jgi:hypothetical protein
VVHLFIHPYFLICFIHYSSSSSFSTSSPSHIHTIMMEYNCFDFSHVPLKVLYQFRRFVVDWAPQQVTYLNDHIASIFKIIIQQLLPRSREIVHHRPTAHSPLTFLQRSRRHHGHYLVNHLPVARQQEEEQTTHSKVELFFCVGHKFFFAPDFFLTVSMQSQRTAPFTNLSEDRPRALAAVQHVLLLSYTNLCRSILPPSIVIWTPTLTLTTQATCYWGDSLWHTLRRFSKFQMSNSPSAIKISSNLPQAKVAELAQLSDFVAGELQ